MKNKLTIIFIIISLNSFSQFKKDTTLAKNQFFANVGASVFGYTSKINSYFSIYYTTGIEYNISKKVKYGFAFNLFRFNWSQLNKSYMKLDDNYSKLTYFSASTDIQLFGRYVINRKGNSYNKYLEFGTGYNLPYYYSLQKYKGSDKTREKSINNYYDLYFYTTFNYQTKSNIPFGLKVEYHPFDIIKNNNYTDISKIKVDILISIFTENDDHK